METLNMEDLKNGIACQSNRLVEARYTLTPNEQKIIILMVALINPNDENFKVYKIRIADFAKLLKINNKNIYPETEDLLYRLVDRTLKIRKEGGYLITGWVSSAEYIKAEGVVELSFDQKLKPYLLQLKQEFTKLDLFTIIQFRSNYTIRIYMLLKQYEKIGIREFDLLDFKKQLRVEKLYPRFNNLRQRIIKQAKKEFDQKDEQGNFLSDINFHFEPIKRGRSVTRIRFTIFQNKHKSLEDPKNVPLIKSDMPILEEKPSTDLSPALKQLLDFGVAGATAEQILKKHTNEYIQEKLQLTTEKDRTNPVGFFVKAIKEDYKSANVAKEKIKQEKEAKALKKKQQEQLNIDIASLTKEFGRIERQNFLDSLTEQELAKLTKEIRQACERDKNGYGLRLFEMGEPLERNFYVESYVNDSIPDFEEARQRYITDKLAERPE